MSLGQGWHLGLEAARSLRRPMRELGSLVGLCALLMAMLLIPGIGVLLAVLAAVPAMVAAMRLEQVAMARAHGGAAPSLRAALGLVVQKSTLPKMLALSVLALASCALLALMPQGALFLFSMREDQSFMSSSPTGPLLAGLRFGWVVIWAWVVQAMLSLWSMVGWLLIVQDDRDVPVFATARDLARSVIPGLIGLYLPEALCLVLSIVLTLAGSFALAGAPGFLSGLALMIFSGAAGTFFAAVMLSALSRGAHLLARRTFMSLEAIAPGGRTG